MCGSGKQKVLTGGAPPYASTTFGVFGYPTQRGTPPQRPRPFTHEPVPSYFLAPNSQKR